MQIRQLLEEIEILETACDMDMEVRGIAYDSRHVSPGDVFVAVRGYQSDGHRYIGAAMEQGASLCVCEEKPGCAIPYVLVRDTRRALALMSCAFFSHPSRGMKMIGITGTNGKTTTTYLVKHILEAQGAKVGLIGTNRNMIGGEVFETERTTPESYELQKLFDRMKRAGCTHVVMEVSSHSLVLQRVAGVRFDVGVFTNLTQDHLDFHKTMEAYCDAKAMLFDVSTVGVLNADDAAAGRLQAHTKEALTYSAKDNANDLVAKNILLKPHGVEFIAVAEEGIARVSLAIPGAFSVYNALAALACAKALGVTLERAAAALATAQGVRGRAELVPVPAPFTVVIDYAHSPDGVENILSAVRAGARGRIVALLGCGGDRDRTKRPKMGAIAQKMADFTIITSDNPRTEKPEEIIREIVAGLDPSGKPYTVVTDRREAIVYALEHARTDDIIVLMGKGHETYQEINGVKHHLDEREEVARFFASRHPVKAAPEE